MNTDTIRSRYVDGTIAPIGPDRHAMPYPEPLLPADIHCISTTIDIQDYTPEGVDEAIRLRYWPCVEELVAQGANRITLAGMPISSQLTRPRALALLEETARKTGVMADSHGEASVAALAHLGAARVAVASRWSDALNEKLVAYLAHAGIEVLAVTAAGQWAKQAFSMSIEEGVKLAFRLGREAMRCAPRAQALFLPGGAWRSLAAVPILEEDFGVPVVTNPIATVWRLIDAGVAPPVRDWGLLLSGSQEIGV